MSGTLVHDGAATGPPSGNIEDSVLPDARPVNYPPTSTKGEPVRKLIQYRSGDVPIITDTEVNER